MGGGGVGRDHWQFGGGSPSSLRFDLGSSARGEMTTLTCFADPSAVTVEGKSTYTYDPVSGLVRSITHGTGAAGTPVASYVYTYDAGNRLSTQQINGGAVTTFSYDAANEVTSDSVKSYTWDSAGVSTNSGFSQGSNVGDQLASGAGWNLSWDAEGNLTSATLASTNAVWAYSYDNADHLTRAVYTPTPGGGATLSVSYYYDALGRKVERDVTTGGSTTVQRYAYNGDNVWADLDGSNNLKVRRFFSDRTDEVVAKIDYPGGTPVRTWYLLDRQGSVLGMQTGIPATVSTQSISAFGVVQGTALSDRYGYTGREVDEYTGLQYNRGRWYDPSIMSWTSRDPSGFTAGDGNLYRYASNNASNATDPTGLDWADYVSGLLPQRVNNWLASEDSAWIKSASDFSAGMADTITAGGTAKVRGLLGYDDVVDRQAAAYRYGGYAGQAVNIALMAVNPAGLAGVALRGINLASSASGLFDAGKAALQGDFSAAGMAVLNVGLNRLRGAGSACTAVSRLAGVAQRGIAFGGMVQGGYGGVQKMMSGDIVGGLLDLAQSAVSAKRFFAACFGAGTRLLTRRGWVAIERLEVGDEVWSRPEQEPGAAGEWKRVEELFVRSAAVLALRVGGQEVLTTAEHPFYIRGKGWLPAGMLEAGQEIAGKDGEWTAVEGVEDSGRYQTVYNCRVADFHTYFVGGDEWAFALWAHNACVYQAKDDQEIVRYVGIANTKIGDTLSSRLRAAVKRVRAHTGKEEVDARVIPGLENITTRQAEAVEHALIGYYGRLGDTKAKGGGTLLNKSGGTNSTGVDPIDQIWIAKGLLGKIRYPGF
jgi:RHS repeat-associated protein